MRRQWSLSVQQVDSIVAAIDSTKELNTFISEGFAMRKGMQKIIGEFADYVYSTNPKVLLKVTNSYSEYSIRETDYYFYHNNLIFVRTVIRKAQRSGIKEIINRQYYFKMGCWFISKKEKPYTWPKGFLKHAEMHMADAKKYLQQTLYEIF